MESIEGEEEKEVSNFEQKTFSIRLKFVHQ